MAEETIDMRKLADSSYPPGPRVRFLRSALRLAYELGFVKADPDPIEPPSPDVCGVPKGVGARPDGPAGPKTVKWLK